ncbi:MAG: hypothetical protein PHI23_00050 [Candidatus Peribacteraceae bacterium]|nr:hypothetical protein [Candidatus Peribacteraceae bacterium]
MPHRTPTPNWWTGISVLFVLFSLFTAASAQDYFDPCKGGGCTGGPTDPSGACCLKETGGPGGTHAYAALNISGAADCTLAGAKAIIGRDMLDTVWYENRNAAVTAIRLTGGLSCVYSPPQSSAAAEESSSESSGSPAVCGNGTPELGEQCDTGANNSNSLPDHCRSTCLLPFCGDQATDSNEECDDGAANSNEPDAACRPSCLLAFCGDGVIDPARGEECDPAFSGTDTCTDICTEIVGTSGGPVYFAPGNPTEIEEVYKNLLNVFLMGLTFQLSNALGIPLQ